MILIKIWQRYCLQKIFLHLLFFFSCLYGIYILLDLCTQSGRLTFYGHFSFGLLFSYYLQHLILRLDLFLPLSFLLAFLSVYIPLNRRNELSALRMMGGISPIRLISPVIILAFFLSVFLLSSFEFFYPTALLKIEEFEKRHLQKETKERTKAYAALYKDGSRLVFQKRSDHEFFDLFWFMNHGSEIWHIQTLKINPETHIAEGTFIDIFEKTKEKGLVKISSKLSQTFENFELKDDQQNLPIESLSLSKLFKISFRDYTAKENQAAAFTHLLFKCSVSTLPLIILFALTPYCLKVRRNAKLFSFVAFALFGLVSFYMFLQSAVILGENLVISPLLALLLPWGVVTLISLVVFKQRTNF